MPPLWFHSFRRCLALCFLVTAGIIHADAPVSFQMDVAPILQQQCVACHGAKKAKSQYRLHTFESLLKPGSSDEAPIVSGRPMESLLFELITSKDADDRMPQDGDPLTEAQIEIIRQWIEQGAAFDGPDRDASLGSYSARPPHPAPPAEYAVLLPITAMAFHPDGETLVTSGYHEVLVWKASTGELLERIENLPRQIYDLAFSPNGQLLAVAGGSPGESGQIAIVPWDTAKEVEHVRWSPEVVLAVCFNPDGSLFGAAGADHSIQIFEADSRELKHEIHQHADWVMDLKFSNDGEHITSASRDRSARVYSVGTAELLSTYYGLGSAVYAAAFSSDGSQVLCAGKAKTMQAWNAQEAKNVFKIGGFGDEIFELVVTDEYVFSCGSDKQVRQHSLKDRKLVREYSGHDDWVYRLAFHSGNHLLASGSYDGVVLVWDVETGGVRSAFEAKP